MPAVLTTYQARVQAMLAGEIDDQRVRCIDCKHQRNYVRTDRRRTPGGFWVDDHVDVLRCYGQPDGRKGKYFPHPTVLRNCETWQSR